MPVGREPPAPCVSIVSSNPETLDGLQAYLGAAGVASRCTSALGELEAIAPPHATAAVIFPDDFVEEDVARLLRHLRRTRPRLLTILVTSEPQRFRAEAEGEGRAPAPLLLPKPPFGWDILDAIRAHATEPK